MMKRIIVIAIAVLFMVMGFSSCGYNTMVSKEEAVTSAVGNLQAAYQKRADLIPNLVATVKNYAEYEAGTLTAVVEARAKATSVTLDAENLILPDVIRPPNDRNTSATSAWTPEYRMTFPTRPPARHRSTSETRPPAS